MTIPQKIAMSRGKRMSAPMPAPLFNIEDMKGVTKRAASEWEELPYKEREAHFRKTGGRPDARYKFVDIYDAIAIARDAVVASSSMFNRSCDKKVVPEMVVFDPDHDKDYPRKDFIVVARQIFCAIMYHLYGVGRTEIAEIVGLHRTSVNHATDAVSDFMAGRRMKELCILYMAHEVCILKTENLLKETDGAAPQMRGDTPDTNGEATDDTQKLVHEPVSKEVLGLEGQSQDDAPAGVHLSEVSANRVSHSNASIMVRKEEEGNSRDGAPVKTGHGQLPEGATGRDDGGGLTDSISVSEQVVVERSSGRGREDSDSKSRSTSYVKPKGKRKRRKHAKVRRDTATNDSVQDQDAFSAGAIWGRMSKETEDMLEELKIWCGPGASDKGALSSSGHGLSARPDDRRRNGKRFR